MPFTLEAVEIEGDQEQSVVESFITPFSLHQAPLMRAKVAKLSDEKYVFMMDMHHIIADGVTRSLLIQELAELYEKRRYRQFSCITRILRYGSRKKAAGAA